MGVDNVDIMENARPGVRLRRGVDRGATVLRVPRSAWISVPLDEPDLEPESELAWQLSRERWLGQASEFAPYVDFLWGVDLGLHPVFWKDEEIAWLRASEGAHEEALEVRRTISERVGHLVERASGPDSGVPAELLAEPSRLEAELRFALVLVEARAIEAEPPSSDEPPCAAMVPILDHLGHDPEQEPSLKVGEDEDKDGLAMLAVANVDLKGGGELRHCYEPVGNAELLAHYGHVPRAPRNRDKRVQMNAFGSVSLPVRSKSEYAKIDSEACLQQKLRLLAERADIDLRTEAEEEVPRLQLPEDLHAGGRFLPLARLLTAPTQVPPGESEEAACEALFARIFQGVGPRAAELPPEMPAPLYGDGLVAEVVARATAWEWCERLLNGYQKGVDAIVEDLGVPMLDNEEDKGGKEREPLKDEELEELVDAVVLAHYKAKTPGRVSAKSKKPREARLLALSEARATVQFLSNGVRHHIPKDWVVGKPTPTSQQPLMVSETRAGRANLALSLLANEAALVEQAYYMTANIVQLGSQLLEAQGNGASSEAFELTQRLRQDWEQEQKQVREAAKKARARETD